MKIVTINEGDFSILQVDGDIDCYTVPQLRESIRQQLENKPGNMIVDLADVTYLDSSAISCLVNAHKDMVKIGYRLGLVNVNRETRQILKLTYVDQIMEIYNSYSDFKV